MFIKREIKKFRESISNEGHINDAITTLITDTDYNERQNLLVAVRALEYFKTQKKDWKIKSIFDDALIDACSTPMKNDDLFKEIKKALSN